MSVQIIELQKQKTKRFQRSRSKSDSNPADSPRTPKLNFSRTYSPAFVVDKKIKRKYSHNLNTSLRTQEPQSIQFELKILQLQQKLQLKSQEETMLKNENNKLRQQLAQFKQKFQSNTPQRQVLREVKGNQNLIRLKKLIVENRCSEVVPTIQALQQQNKRLKADNVLYRTSAIQLQKMYKELCKKVQASQRQNQLQETVLKLQLQLKNQEQENRKLDMRLKIALAKTINQQRNSKQAKQQQIQNLKLRYSKLLKKYHNLSQELNSIKQKMEAQTYLKKIDSLSLSPEGM